MYVTDHASLRMRKRCGIPKKSVHRIAQSALDEGITHKECTGGLKRYIDGVFLEHHNGGKIRIYHNYVYIFTLTDTLITVLELPHKFRNVVNKLKLEKGG